MAIAVMRAVRNLALAGAALVAAAVPATAEPQPWAIGLQEAVTPIAEMIHRFNNGVLILLTVIVLFVLALLVYCMVRFNARANPVPAKTTHNTLIEVVWTVVPILILVGLAVPSFALLFAEHDPARAIVGYDPEKTPPLTIKATGSQWYWTYEYPDNGGLSFDSLLVRNEKGEPAGNPRLLEVDNVMVVPTGVVVRMQVIGAEVIHAFAMPAFGVKIDAVPGRLNETWFRVDKEGIYYGQCSELCGRDHAFMPIAVRAVSPEKFKAWADVAGKDLPGAYKALAASIAADKVRVAEAVK